MTERPAPVADARGGEAPPQRSIAIALALGGLVAPVLVVTIAKLGPAASCNRPL